MPTGAAATVEKILESLPETVQDRIGEHMQDYIEDLRDELKWSDAFAKTQHELAQAAQQARKQIDQGNARPLGLREL